jgi:hypothetical protein
MTDIEVKLPLLMGGKRMLRKSFCEVLMLEAVKVIAKPPARMVVIRSGAYVGT